MAVKASGVGLVGIDGVLIEVEIGAQDGLPGLDITGLPAASVREARFRVKSAFRRSDYPWPEGRLVANFAPADLPKAGTAYDLPLAMAVLAFSRESLRARLADFVFYGELALDGSVREVPGAVNAALATRAGGRRALVVGPGNADEAAAVPGIEVYVAETLYELVEALEGRASRRRAEPVSEGEARRPTLDLADIRGQARARRALEVAAAGGHNLLMVGPPGCGKTLLARAMVGILPPMSLEERLEVTRIHSVSGLTRGSRGLASVRPFRAPHATASFAALVGGGNPPRPGELSLAHRGVLFLDETPEFNRLALESLRAPLEDRAVTITRAARAVTFPSAVSLVCAMNPCPCGHKDDPTRPCRCTRGQVEAYRSRLSGPLLDRMDIQVALSPVPPELLAQATPGEASEPVRERVMAARERQLARREEAGGAATNAELAPGALEQVAPLGRAERRHLANAARTLGLTARSWHRVIKVARTVADLEGAERVDARHLSEALTYRLFEREGSATARGAFAPRGR